ncbi:hypothetical protein V6760_03490 [Acinetobacter venetianus]
MPIYSKLYSKDVASIDLINSLITFSGNLHLSQDELNNIYNFYHLDNISKDNYESFKVSGKIDVLTTLIHEATHFIDMTLSTWGGFLTFVKFGALERKLELEKNPADSHAIAAYENSCQRFEIGFKQIEFIHEKYSECYQSNNENLENSIFQHFITYEDDFGPLVYFRSVFDNQKLDTVLSMLAVLEANAVCTEILAKYSIINKINDEVYKKIELITVDKEYKKEVLNPLYMEYNIYLVLLMKIFDGFSIFKIAKLCKLLVNYILNLMPNQVSYFSEYLFNEGEKRLEKISLKKEMQRGEASYYLLLRIIIKIDECINSGMYDVSFFEDISEVNIHQFMSDVFETDFQKESDFIFYQFLRDNDAALENIMKNKDFISLLDDLVFNQKIYNYSFNNVEKILDFRLPNFYIEDTLEEMSFLNKFSVKSDDLMDGVFKNLYDLQRKIYNFEVRDHIALAYLQHEFF